MMGKAQTLLQDLGGNMAESLGRRTGEAPGVSPLSLHAASNKKLDGRTRSRDAGEMLLENIIPDPTQPRKEFDADAIERLSKSLKEHGQLQAIRVRWSEENGKWVILAGERRYRAAKAAGLKTVACIFVENELTEMEILEEQLIENCLREDLKPIEQAVSFKALMDRNGWTGKELAERLHLNPSGVTRALALLTLPEDIQEKVAEGTVAPSVAYEVTKLDDETDRREVIEEAITGKLSRQAVVETVNKRRAKTPKKPQARTSTVTLRTRKKWTVVVTIPKKKASDAEVLGELESVVEQLRAKLDTKGEAA
jgi:ParB family chromosome partitioning protein